MRRANVGWLALTVLTALVSASPIAARTQSAQAGGAVKPEALVGTYQGTATHSAGGSMPLTMTIKLEKDTFTGSVETGGTQGTIPITSGSLTGNRLVLTFAMIGAPATLTCTVTDPSRLEGSWVAGDASGTVALARLSPEDAKALADKAAEAPSAAAPTGAKPGANPSDPITGQWDGVTGNSDMQIPFTMNLKLDGEKVTGDISSEQGGAPLSVGTWKNGALNLSFELGGAGTVTMVASLQEGKLVGSLDVGGQMQMQWAAVRK